MFFWFFKLSDNKIWFDIQKILFNLPQFPTEIANNFTVKTKTVHYSFLRCCLGNKATQAVKQDWKRRNAVLLCWWHLNIVCICVDVVLLLTFTRSQFIRCVIQTRVWSRDWNRVFAAELHMYTCTRTNTTHLQPSECARVPLSSFVFHPHSSF